jgi:zinc and cadmium transporter
VSVVSAVSFTGVLTLSLQTSVLKKILIYLVGFSAGALLGGALIHLLPRAVSTAGSLNLRISLYAMSGIFVFFLVEKFVHWKHRHGTGKRQGADDSEPPMHLGVMNLVGDGAHNFIDGLVIAASYLAGYQVGLTTTIAVILHEIPQEIGDFGVLLYAGFERKKALLFNFFTAVTALAGAVAALLVGRLFENFSPALVPFTAGGFLYIAAADLIPELQKEQSPVRSVIQFIALLCGVGLMIGFTLME